MNDWHKIYITDKNGGKHFNTYASPIATWSEIRNLKRHIEQAKRYPDQYKFLDPKTAIIMLDGSPF